MRIEERTQALNALQHANDQLLVEVAERKQTEETLRRSEAQLRDKTQQLEETLQNLTEIQAQLVQTEKMSSLGQLLAGIATIVVALFWELTHDSSCKSNTSSTLSDVGRLSGL